MKKLTTIIALLLVGFGSIQAQYAKEILLELEKRMQGKSSYVEMSVVVQRPKWSREMTLKSWSKGDKLGVSVVTSPAKEKGTVFLIRDKEVWNYLPSIDRTIKMPPSMMMQSWMGTDLTNDDLVKESSMVNDFTHTLLGKETMGGKECYKIQSIAKEDAAVVWGKVISWIDTKDYIQMKAEFYDEDEELVNTFTGLNVKMMGGKMIASKMEILPANKKSQKTTFEYKSIDFTTAISDDFFTVQNMKKVK